jgi:cytochrome c-type biogenesis protein CcmH/NrfG
VTEPDSERTRPSRLTNPLVVVALLVAAIAVYLVLIGSRGLFLLGQDRWTLKLLGLAVLVLPLIGIWVVVAELRFGAASQRLAERLELPGEQGEPGKPAELGEMPRSHSGPVDRATADAWFDQQRAIVEQAPEDWRRWFRLAQAYDLAGDRKRAREALRTAISKAA